MKCRLVITTITVLAAFGLRGADTQAAQEEYKFAVGGGLGLSSYLGDVNESSLLKHIGVSFGGTFEYLINTRMAIKGNFTAASLSGNSADWDNVLPGGKNYEFTSWVYDIGGHFQFNFFNYGIGESYKKLHRFTPYFSLGLGATLSSCDGKSFAAMNLPMGIGVKYKLKPRLNLGAEFMMTKVFGDHVDGELKDLYEIKSSFLKNTDWYATLMFTLTYEFGQRCVVCNRLD